MGDLQRAWRAGAALRRASASEGEIVCDGPELGQLGVGVRLGGYDTRTAFQSAPKLRRVRRFRLLAMRAFFLGIATPKRRRRRRGWSLGQLACQLGICAQEELGNPP